MENIYKKIANFLRRLLPILLAFLTKSDRYFPEYEWSNLWSINAFRVYESIFGRRVGIRAETSLNNYKIDGKWIQVIKCWSLESKMAHREVRVREFIKRVFRLPHLEFEYIPVPVFALAGIPSGGEKLIPYSFAIAYDNSVEQPGAIGSSPFSYSYTVTGSNPGLFVSFGSRTGSVSPISHGTTGITYNSEALTQLESTDTGTPGQCFSGELWFKGACATGNNTIACSWSSGTPEGYNGAASYSGVSATVDAHANGHNYPSTLSTNSLVITVVGTNCWVIAFVTSGNAINSAGSGTTMRVVSSDTYNEGWYDSGGVVSAGSYTLNVNLGGAGDNNCVRVGASVAPYPATIITIKRLGMTQAVNRASTY